MAEGVDLEGDRTLGILTKPGLAEKDGADLIEDRRHTLKLGWHLLRNPGQEEVCDKPSARSAIEEVFFRTVSPWNDLDKDKVGVQSLRKRLEEILATHIRRKFPKVRYGNICHDIIIHFMVKLEISHKLQATNTKLQSLGRKRQSQSEQMQYLMDITIHFQDAGRLQPPEQITD
jgi:hypothetical protein